MADTTGTPSAPRNASRWERIWEAVQTVGLAMAFFMGANKTPRKDEQTEVKEIPGWLMDMFPSLTREDETEFALILNSHKDPSIKEVESAFRKRFILAGYNETKYRLNVVHMRREYVERMREKMPKDENGSRMTFESLKMKDPVYEFLSEIIAASVAEGPDPEAIYKRQEEIALNIDLLEKSGWIGWMQKNKKKTLAFFLLLPFVAIAAILKLIFLIL